MYDLIVELSLYLFILLLDRNHDEQANNSYYPGQINTGKRIEPLNGRVYFYSVGHCIFY